MAEINELTAQLAGLLLAADLKLVTAESCTGGGIASACTDLAGSSKWFERGYVTYSNAAKQQDLQVPEKTLIAHGAVSEATVLAMVRGALTRSGADVAIAVSGIAGPSGGTNDKPVGTVWLAWGGQEPCAQCFHFDGNRAEVRHQAIQAGLAELIKWLKK